MRGTKRSLHEEACALNLRLDELRKQGWDALLEHQLDASDAAALMIPPEVQVALREHIDLLDAFKRKWMTGGH